MSITTKTTTTTVPIILQQTLSYKELDKVVSAFSLTYKYSVQNNQSKKKSRHWGALRDRIVQGLTLTSQIEDFEKGLREEIVASPELSLVPPSFLKAVVEEGYHRALDRYDKEIIDVTKNLLTAPDDWVVVKGDWGNYLLFDTSGEILPSAQEFDYLSGNIDDSRYDLKKLLACLKNNPRVHHLPGYKELKIEAIPSYNAYPGRQNQIKFTLELTLEQMREVWARAKTLHKKYPSTELHRSIFELDLLGAKQAGAVYVENYWDTRADG